jgi:hypothetical protein
MADLGTRTAAAVASRDRGHVIVARACPVNVLALPEFTTIANPVWRIASGQGCELGLAIPHRRGPGRGGCEHPRQGRARCDLAPASRPSGSCSARPLRTGGKPDARRSRAGPERRLGASGDTFGCALTAAAFAAAAETLAANLPWLCLLGFGRSWRASLCQKSWPLFSASASLFWPSAMIASVESVLLSQARSRYRG